MGITDKNLIQEIKCKYTWHHLDDLDDLDENLESTFQLVETKVHSKLKHVGSVNQIKKATGITDIYKTK